MIREFKNEYNFLSNFYPHPIYFNGLLYKTSEHAYQAQKCVKREDMILFTHNITPGKAKRLGRKLKIRDDWDMIKLDVMKQILIIKFSDEKLKKLLKDTGDNELVEGNYWNDAYWGVDIETGIGKNNLGKLLMDIRSKIYDE